MSASHTAISCGRNSDRPERTQATGEVWQTESGSDRTATDVRCGHPEQVAAIRARIPTTGSPVAYAGGVSHDPAAEHQRVRAKYAPTRPFESFLYVLTVVLLAIVSLFREVDWFFFAGVLVAAAAWEVTKFRLRSNARRFADSDR